MKANRSVGIIPLWLGILVLCSKNLSHSLQGSCLVRPPTSLSPCMTLAYPAWQKYLPWQWSGKTHFVMKATWRVAEVQSLSLSSSRNRSPHAEKRAWWTIIPCTTQAFDPLIAGLAVYMLDKNLHPDHWGLHQQRALETHTNFRAFESCKERFWIR